MKEKDTLAQDPKPSDNSNQKSNLFFIFASLFLFICILFLGYRILEKSGLLSHSSNQEKPKNVKEFVQVEVLNGCGVQGVGDKLKDIIRAKGFDVVKTGNYRSFDVENTFLIDRIGKVETAYRLADSIRLSKKNIIEQVNKNYFLDLTLVIGKDYKAFINN